MMKKILLFMVAIAATVMFANAQGTWYATGDDATTYNPATELGMGINNLQVMHSDASGISDKSDTGAPAITYGDITYDNTGFIQGSNNGMYFAFLPAVDGTLDASLKMSSNKNTFIYELTDAAWTTIGISANDITTLTTAIGVANAIQADPSFYSLPQVYDTYNNSTATWDGTAPIQATGSSVYMVTSFPVTANKTYIIGVFGSKLMVRGINFSNGTSGINGISTKDATVVKTEYYSVLGRRLSEPTSKGITIVKEIMSDGSIHTTKRIFQK